LAAASVAAVIALLAWALVPSFPTGRSVVTIGGGQSAGSGPTAAGPAGGSTGGAAAAGSAGSAGTAATGSSSGAGAVAGTSGASSGQTGPGGRAATGGANPSTSAAGPAASHSGSAASTASGCGPLTSTDKGVTANQITIGVVLPDLGQLNPALGLPSYSDQQKMYNAVFDSYNKQGGVQCRRLVPRYYDDNVADASSEQAVCLQIQQDGDFAVLNNLYNPQEFNCLAQRAIPNIFYTSPHTPAMRQFFPYVLAMVTDYDRLIKDYVFGAQKMGLLRGQKIGILEQTCYPEENTDIESDLASIGITAASKYNYGCVTSGASPSTPDEDQTAALQFRSAGVTLVLQTARGVVTNFAQQAQAQGYTPKYAMMNDQSMSLVADNSTPIPSSFNGAIAITTDQEGATNTAGAVPTPATAACTRIAAAIGLPPPDDQHRLAGQLDGAACAVVATLVAALTHVSSPVRSALAYGLAKAGQIDLSAPEGPMDITNPQVPAGGQFWRPAQWYTSCGCWKVTNLRWSPGWN
jgi:hypothetical protein